MMTSADKAAKAKEILNSNPSEEDMAIAVGLAKEAAAEGDPEGLYVLGQLYHRGEGMEPDYGKAFGYFQKALAAGCEKAKSFLAIYYVTGNVVERNLPLAEQYLQDQMTKNDAVAYIIMGDFVFQGAFADIEWSSFAGYFQKAVEAGEPFGMIKLAEKYNILCEPDQAEYWYGKAEEAGVREVEMSRQQFTEDNYADRRRTAVNIYIQNGMYDKAFALVNRDAATGDTLALYLQAECCARGLGGEAYGRDVRKALQIYGRLAAEGDSHANYSLGLMYCVVEEIKDNQKALEYTQRAAEADHPDAQCVLGKYYIEGAAGDKDMAKAAEWIEKAAAQGQQEALFILAASYLQDSEIDAISEYSLDYQRDEKRGVELLQQAARTGSANALFCLYLCYRQGKYLEQDDDLAFLMLSQSAQIEITPETARLIGNAYREGKGVGQDSKQAVAYYEWAVANGDIPALGNLGLMYQEGDGVEKDQEKADVLLGRYSEQMRWLINGVMPLDIAREKAAQGDGGAMCQLGNRYLEGDGVEHDMKKAAEWWQKAHEAGDLGGTHNLGYYYLREGEDEKGISYLTQSSAAGYAMSYHVLGEYYLSNAEEEGNIQKGMSNMTTAAELGYAPSQWNLVSIYHDGEIVPEDYDKARYWLDKCLASNFPQAHYGMGKCLFCGDMYEQDYAQALEHLRTAVERGVHEADALYIQLRWNGHGVEADRGEVVRVFAALAERNDAIAMWQLYMFYTDESFENHDTAKAIDYLKQSASQGYIDAIAQLAWHYYWGEGVEKDVRLAVGLYKSAAEAGNLGSVMALARCYIAGEEDIVEPDYDKAIELLKPHLESDDGEVDFLMAYAVRCKCDMKNAYSWEQAEQAFEYMKKAAEEGYADAMYRLAQYYMEGYGVYKEDVKNEKQWLEKYVGNGGTLTDEENPALCSDEIWEKYSVSRLYNSIKTIVEANTERIENPLEMVNDDDCLNAENILLNAAQLGEANAVLLLGQWGLNELKTDPEKAKAHILAACKGGVPEFACRAGMEWLEEGLDNEVAVESAMEYLGMGAEQGSLDCWLQIGLLCTDKRLESEEGYGETLKYGKEALQAVVNVEGDDYEEQRQQARQRLAELEQRPKSKWSKIKSGLGSLFGKD